MDKRIYDVPAMLQKADKIFADWAAMGKPQDRFGKVALAKRKIYESRGWLPSKLYIEKNFDELLQTLRVFYFPKAHIHGPAFVFPIRGLDDQYTQAQIRPCEGSPMFDANKKYQRLGSGRHYASQGPPWLGNDLETIRRMIKLRVAILVEGPFDLLACRLLVPEAPVISSLTKGIGEDHLDYLSILGVNRMCLMFDNEASGQGQKGVDSTKRLVQKKSCVPMVVESLPCPAADPSAALKSRVTAVALKAVLNDAIGGM